MTNQAFTFVSFPFGEIESSFFEIAPKGFSAPIEKAEDTQDRLEILPDH